MAVVHSNKTVIIIDGNDISRFCSDSNAEQSSGTEDITTYGKNAVVKGGTLLDGAFGCSGFWDDDETDSPEAAIRPLVGQTVVVQYYPEGLGSGLPRYEFDAVLTKFTTTAPVANHRLFSIETEPSDEWLDTPQS